MDITFNNKSASTITTVEYQFTIEGKNITYIEYINDKSKLTDCVLRDETGCEINDDNNLGFDNIAALLEEIQAYVDAIV